MEDIFIKDTGKYGRGIFALRDFRKGELIESAPVIILPKDERRYIKKTQISDYFFNWGKKYNKAAIALGYGSLYNHSYSPNAQFINNLKKSTIDFFSISDIKKGDEITVNYNGEPEDQSPLWFDIIE